MRRINPPPSCRRGVAVGEQVTQRCCGYSTCRSLVLILMVGVYLVLLLRLGDLEDQVAKLDAEIARQNAALAELSPTGISRRASKQKVADGIFRSRFTWDQVLQALALSCRRARLDTFTAEAAPVDIDAPVEQPWNWYDNVGIALPVTKCGLRRADGQPPVSCQRGPRQAALRNILPEPAVSFEVASELVTLVGDNGRELEGGSQG